MREALHVIDNDIVRLPYSASVEEVSNLKKLAEKDLFQCPYCSAKLIVKYGDERGLYFSHQHSEACVESKDIDKAEKRYRKQTERETKVHKVMINIVHDELTIQAKSNPQINVDYGFKAKSNLKEFPDLWVKIADKEFALSIVSDVKSTVDSKLANQIIKRHQYFLEHGMEPIWFIEKKEQSIERDKNSIVLWDAELTIAAKTKEDKEWDLMIVDLVKDKMFYKYFNYPVSMNNLPIDVRSMYYIYSNEERIVVKVQRFLKDRIVKPYRAFLLKGYEIPLSDALIIKNEFLLSNPKIENQNRKEFTQEFQRLQFEFREKQRLQKEQRQQEEEQRQKLIQEMSQQEEERRKKLLQQFSEQKPHANQQPIIVSSYNDLKIFLKEKIGLTQAQQMELWTIYLPKIGLKNSSVIWELFVEHDCKSFDELRNVLRNFIVTKNK